jgi:hypothetical protein
MIVKFLKDLSITSITINRKVFEVGTLSKTFNINLEGKVNLYLNDLYDRKLLEWLRDNLKDGELIVL